MRFYCVKGDALCGPTAHRSLKEALEEVAILLSEDECPSVGFGVRVEIGEMTEEEFDALPEFEGY